MLLGWLARARLLLRWIYNKYVILMDILKTMLNEAISGCSRRTVVQPIIWAIACMGVVIDRAAAFKATDGILYGLIGIIAALVLFFFIVYWRQLRIDPDSLRSEKYYFYKKAIETQQAMGMLEPPKETLVIPKPEVP